MSSSIKTSDGIGGVGVHLGSRSGGDDPPCETIDDRAMIDEWIAADNEAAGAALDGMSDRISGLLDRFEKARMPLHIGLSAVPPARYVLSSLGELDEARVPNHLPSEFFMTVIAAPREYAEALALERMLVAGGADEAVAVKFLGDARASAPAVPVLRIKLRSAVDEGREPTAGLVLRALLAADPAVAREEASRLLDDPRMLRPALGVFAPTDPVVAKELDTLDTTDESALEEAAARLAARLEATEPDRSQPP